LANQFLFEQFEAAALGRKEAPPAITLSGPPFGIGISRFQEDDEMAGKREKPEDIVLKLRQVEVLQGQGSSVQEAVRQIGVTVQTYYRWRKQYGGMSRDQLKRLKELETENSRLRRAVSDLTLDKMILAEAARGNF
jgi:DNA invertase Pin-like site-specific DNA recombinase